MQELESEGQVQPGTSRNLSVGGMALATAANLRVGQALTLQFELPLSAKVRLKGVVCWVYASGYSYGVRFVEEHDHKDKD